MKNIQGACITIIITLIYIKNLFLNKTSDKFSKKFLETFPTATLALILDLNDLTDLDQENNMMHSIWSKNSFDKNFNIFLLN